ncbi:hypothetical protein CAAN1_07S02410 [[Candida] anglica]
MSTLTLQEDDLFMVRFTWSNLLAKKKSGQKDFMNKLFANMINSNPKLKSLFHSEAIAREQASLVGEMLSFTVAYIDDPETLSECMSSFVEENSSISRYGIHYIEPMGISLIQTFHQFLPKGKFTPQLEGLWVKVYLHLANSFLQCSNDNDGHSLVSIESEKEEPPQPKFGPVKVKFQLSSNEKYRGFRRSANEEPDRELEASVPTYEQPRSTTGSTMKISSPIQTPLTPVSSASPTPFDPRKSRRNSKPLFKEESKYSSVSSEEEEEEQDIEVPAYNPRRLRPNTFKVRQDSEPIQNIIPVVEKDEMLDGQFQDPPTPPPKTAPIYPGRDPRRLQFKKPLPAQYDSDSDEESMVKRPAFDPRKLRRKQVETPVESEVERDDESVYTTTAPLFTSRPAVVEDEDLESAFESPTSDPEENSLMEELIQLTTQIPERTVSSESHQHPYGNGLAPIREYDDDCASSKYDSENETIQDNTSSTYERSSSHDEVSSGVSTLSLHNSDYRSSISSGNSSPNFSPFQSGKPTMTHQPRQASQSSEISYMKPLDIPEPRTTYAKPQAKYRASAGFMKSSFILSQVMNSQTTASQKAPPAVQSTTQPTIATITPVVKNVVDVIPAQIKEEPKVSLPTLASPVESDSEDDCLDLINSFVPVTANKKQAPVPALTRPAAPFAQQKAISQPRSHPQLRRSSTRSTTSLQSAKQPAVVVYNTPVKRSLKERLGLSRSSSRKNSLASASTSDLCSIKSNESCSSTFSGFSFFSSTGSNTTRRASLDTRRQSIDTRASRKTDKYNRVKGARFSMFGSAF